ncbi:MAG: TonB C-terminal domain-containing protein [Candidatus Obscuribacter sp.]|nr:TonB C-terminal domain-containing protein [Candidatus Obscuribacter sp.]
MKPHFGQNNPYLASTLNTLAEAYKNNNQLSKAQILEKEADGIFQTFMDNLNRKIKSEWNPPKSDSSKKAVSMFGLNAEGKFENIKLTKPSSSPALNEACLNALRTTDKMPITTPSFYKIDIEPIWIEFSFDYRIHNGPSIASRATWPTTEKISNGKVATYESQSNHSFENRKKELEQETSKDTDRVKALLEQKEQLSDQNLLSLFIYTEKLREINQFGKTNELTRMMQKRNDCQIADSPPNLIMRSIEPLDLARQGNVIDAENKLKSIIQSSQFEKIESSHIRNHLLKKYGDLLYKQNKVEQANALYAKIRN